MFWKKESKVIETKPPIKQDEDKYFINLLERSYLPSEFNEIKSRIDENGHWEESEEWRISTYTDFKITKLQKDSLTWYRVEVKCDHEFTCHCQTLERATQMAGLYHQIILKSFYQIGWASRSP